MVITSVDNKNIVELVKLKQSKYRKKNKLFLVEGEHLIREALNNNKLISVYVLEDTEISFPVETTYVTIDVMKKLSDLDNPSNMIGVCKIEDNSEITGNRILLLDRIQDPGNLGTIIRSALAFNIDTVILSNDTVDLYNSKVIRSTQGMLFGLNIITMDLVDAIKIIKSRNIEVYGTKVDNGIKIDKVNKEKYAIVMGNEGQGVSSKILDLCDKYIYIDMNKKVESLNVAVATSIILYELDK